jgi:hypothetical protein
MKPNYPRIIIVFALLVVTLIVGAFGSYHIPARADSVTTSVTVGNSAPSISVAPAENPASDTTTPTNVGSSVTIQMTATDSNSENYYLAVCKTNSVTAVNGGSPTCPGGSWCISTSTASGSQSSCAYTTLVGDVESNAWYAFACDGNASAAACSSSSQGSGSSGSPFAVNHRPTFNAISNDGPKNPGATLTFSTDASTLDSDTGGTADTVKLIVCKTTGITNDDCDGGASDRWCASSYVASNPSCNFALDNPLPDASYNAYTYLVDSHYFAATGANQGANTSFTVNNTTPSVSAVAVNGGSNMTLTEGTTTNITLAATITDTNSCTDISAVVASLYRTGIGYSSCDDNAEDNDNYCYADVSCSAVGAGNTCTGTTDASVDYTCTVAVQYHADPTDTSTVYPTETWKDTFEATDDDAAAGTGEVSSGVEVNSLVAYDVSTSISYGSLSVGQKNDPLDKTTTITATGNVGLDEELSGTDMTSGGNTIGVAYQKYALAGSTAYASGTALSTSGTEAELNCLKTTVSGTPATKNTWWGLEIPAGTVSGSYSGTNTIIAIKGETANW